MALCSSRERTDALSLAAQLRRASASYSASLANLLACARASVPALLILCGASGSCKDTSKHPHALRTLPSAQSGSAIGRLESSLPNQLQQFRLAQELCASTTALYARPGAAGARRVEDPWACLTTARATSHACVDVS